MDVMLRERESGHVMAEQRGSKPISAEAEITTARTASSAATRGRDLQLSFTGCDSRPVLVGQPREAVTAVEERASWIVTTTTRSSDSSAM
jgi:hypothetical protein